MKRAQRDELKERQRMEKEGITNVENADEANEGAADGDDDLFGSDSGMDLT